MGEDHRLGIAVPDVADVGENICTHPTSLVRDDARCIAEFCTAYRSIYAFVAQWIERRFPKPQVAGSIPAEGAILLVSE